MRAQKLTIPLIYRKSRFLVAALLALFFISGCGTNPVTGKREFQFVSTESEIQIGKQNYLPARQVQGGDYIVDKTLTRYVQSVGNRLAAASDRQLPYEFEVINNPVPNAWALPGGKIAINRGLLMELGSEAELAAVLGHEVVHAAARHGAKAQERGMFMQGGMLAAQIYAQGKEYGNLIAGGAMLGAQLLSSKYSRGAELESDQYGMKYMVKAGYHPEAAVDLQETFVRLSEGRKTDWLQGLFASHPPSQERVAANRVTAAELLANNPGATDYGRERYRRAIAPLVRDKEAYAAHDQALKAAKEGNFANATKLVDKAIRLQPREAKFYGLKGDLALHQKKYRAALSSYDKALARYPDYFAFHLNSGLAKKALNDRRGAAASFERANQIVPTPIATKELGDLALAGGNRAAALKYYQAAAQSPSEIGKAASVSMARLELPSNPGKYIKAQVRMNNGKVVIVVANQSAVPVTNVQGAAAYFDQYGQQTSQAQSFTVRQIIRPGQYVILNTNWQNPNGLKLKVQSAAVSQR